MAVRPATVADVDQSAAGVRDRCDAAGIDLFAQPVRDVVLKMAVEIVDAVRDAASAHEQRNAALRVATGWLYALPVEDRA